MIRRVECSETDSDNVGLFIHGHKELMAILIIEKFKKMASLV